MSAREVTIAESDVELRELGLERNGVAVTSLEASDLRSRATLAGGRIRALSLEPTDEALSELARFVGRRRALRVRVTLVVDDELEP